MATKCYSVRVQCIREISEKAVVITSFDGSEDVFPKSAIFGRDWEVGKSEAYWIAAWILPKKEIQWGTKKSATFDGNGRKLPTVEYHTPERMEPTTNLIQELKKEQTC